MLLVFLPITSFHISQAIYKLLFSNQGKYPYYIIEQTFRVYLCRKANPESKGKVENVVKFVKDDFLYGRAYFDINTLQARVMIWLQRTGNGMPHSTIRKIPLQEWAIEKEQLRSWVSIKILPPYIMSIKAK